MKDDKAHLSRVVNQGFLDAVFQAVSIGKEIPIYHYTSTDGLIGIMSNNELWLGNIDDLNDITEINYGFDNIIIPAIENSSELTDISKNKVKELIELVRTKSFSLLMNDNDDNDDDVIAYKCNVDIFVFSTSTNGNAYTMWSNYTKNDNKAGYAISMNITDVYQAIMTAMDKRSTKKDSKIGNYLLNGRIVYSQNEQMTIINKYISLLEYNLKEKNDQFQKIIYEAFVEGLLVLSLFFKDEEFSKEDEYRYVVMIADEITDMDNSVKPYLKFINVNGTIMSRLVLPFDSSKIKQIIASPYIAEQSKVEQQLHFFAKKCGIPNVEIKTNMSKKIR